jgi:hypothetical protein
MSLAQVAFNPFSLPIGSTPSLDLSRFSSKLLQARLAPPWNE